MTVEGLLQEYTHLPAADVHDVLAYAYEHADKLEEDLAGDDKGSVQRKYATCDPALCRQFRSGQHTKVASS
jgi:hypothetical protein